MLPVNYSFPSLPFSSFAVIIVPGRWFVNKKMGICRDETAVLIESKDVETDEICDAIYIIEKHRQEALLLHLGRLIMKTYSITST